MTTIRAHHHPEDPLIDPRTTEQLPPRCHAVLDYVAGHPSGVVISRRELAAALGMPVAHLDRAIRLLRQRGLLALEQRDGGANRYRASGSAQQPTHQPDPCVAVLTMSAVAADGAVVTYTPERGWTCTCTSPVCPHADPRLIHWQWPDDHGVTPAAAALAAVLGAAEPLGATELAEDLRLSEHQLRDALQPLITAGWLDVVRPRCGHAHLAPGPAAIACTPLQGAGATRATP